MTATAALTDPAPDAGDNPLIGVGLMCYGRADELRHALRALVGQTYRNLDILISDNASPDPRVAEVIREFAGDPRIRTVRQPENIGFIRNFRYVFEHTRGDFFMWASDDDIMAPAYIETCLRNMLKAKNRVVLSFTHIRKVDRNGVVVDPDFADPIHTDTPSMMRRSLRYLYHSGGNQCCYGLFRREAVSHWYFERRFGNDHSAIMDALRQGNIHFDKRVLFTSTIGGAGYQRRGFHTYYAPDDIAMKVCVNLSSTLTWWYEFLRYIALTPYKPHEKLVLWAFTFVRFARPRYWRRFAGDMLALFTRRDIWNFKER